MEAIPGARNNSSKALRWEEAWDIQRTLKQGNKLAGIET